MGQRTATETLFGIVSAFVENRVWSQADLAKRLETRTETIRTYLMQLKAYGFKLDREEDRPHVYWSVPKNWLPGVLPFTAEESKDLLRMLGRSRQSALRERVLAVVVARLANLGHFGPEIDLSAVQGPAVAEDEERWLAIVEDAIARRIPLKMRYYSASRRHESWRHVSVHRVDLGSRPQFVATCHKADALRRFRMSNVLEARLDQGEKVRVIAEETLRQFESETFGGYHHDGPAVRCSFFVRDPESAWVGRNLPDERIEQEPVDGGLRFTVTTASVGVLARFVVGLGDAARPETPELAAAVARIAEGALANAITNRPA